MAHFILVDGKRVPYAEHQKQKAKAKPTPKPKPKETVSHG